MNFIIRTIRYTRIHLFKNPKYFFSYFLAFFSNSFQLCVNFYTQEEVKNLITKGKSLIRFGDGEIYIMNFGSIGYQEYHKDIRRIFFEIVCSYAESTPYVVCINELVMNKSNEELKKEGVFNCWLPMKVYYKLYFPKDIKYVDASIFYYKNSFKNILEEYLLDKHVIYMTRKETLDSLKKNTKIPFTSVSYIETGDKNAYSRYEELNEKLSHAVKEVPEGKTPVVLMACSQAGKILAYEWSKKGVQVLDIGVGIEIMYTEKSLDYMLMKP